MISTIPLPTDSIYKFYTLCGLAILISSMLAFTYRTDLLSERIDKNSLEWAVLNRTEKLSPEEEERQAALHARLRVDKLDRIGLVGLAAVGGAIWFLMMLFGLISWHTKIQPNHDKLLELQIKKLEREILALDKELAETSPGPD